MLKMPVSIFKQVRFMKQSLFLKKCSKFCYVLFAVCGCLACTQNQKIEWPQVTNETKPWTRWWWEGNAVRTIDLDTVMRKYQEANLGGLEITPIYGIHGYEDRFKDFLSPEWVDLFLYTLQEAKQLGLVLIWLMLRDGRLEDLGSLPKMRARRWLIKLIN